MDQVRSYAAVNDTDQWAVLVDGYFQLFQSQREASDVHHKICRVGVEYTIFDSCGLMPPHSGPALDQGSLGNDRLSQFEQTDLLAYAARREQEERKRKG